MVGEYYSMDVMDLIDERSLRVSSVHVALFFFTWRGGAGGEC